MNQLEFVIGALKDLKTVGTVFPCSVASAKKMTKPVDFSSALTIVELGGGTGAITKEILKNMRPDAKLYVFEIHPKFAQALREMGDPRMVVIEDSAEHMEAHLEKLGITQADAVISTLPLVLIDEKVRNEIMDAAMRVVKPSGCFVQIQLSLLTKKEMQARFENLKIDFTPLNIPPAFFYIVTKDPETQETEAMRLPV